jgi:hypothetical protein
MLIGCAAMAAPAFGDLINYDETTYGLTASTPTTGLTIGNEGPANPMYVSAILNEPYTKAGVKTYSSTTAYATYINDGTGSGDLYAGASNLNGNSNNYTPTVGDSITITNAEWDPYQQLPEYTYQSGHPLDVTLNSQNNLTPATSFTLSYAPGVTFYAGNNGGGSVAPADIINSTVSGVTTLNSGILPLGVAGYLVDINDAYIGNGAAYGGSATTPGSFGTSNITLSVTDSTGTEELYYWESSYSLAFADLYGMNVVTTVPADIIGFETVYTPATGSPEPEFNPIAITYLPEPMSAGLVAAGCLAMTMRRRRKA